MVFNLKLDGSLNYPTFAGSEKLVFNNSPIYGEMNGEIIDIIFQGEIYPGNHQFKWDAKHRSSGIYFINLISNGISIKTEKVILVK